MTFHVREATLAAEQPEGGGGGWCARLLRATAAAKPADVGRGARCRCALVPRLRGIVELEGGGGVAAAAFSAATSSAATTSSAAATSATATVAGLVV